MSRRPATGARTGGAGAGTGAGANRIEVVAADRPIREVNEELRAAVADGREAVVRDTRSRHNLGVGLPAGARVRFEGSVGYYCGGLNDGARIEIERNAGWGVGEAMADGEIVVGGYAGMAAGASMRGGVLHVRGDAGPASHTSPPHKESAHASPAPPRAMSRPAWAMNPDR